MINATARGRAGLETLNGNRRTITIPRHLYTDAPEPRQQKPEIERKCICCGAPESQVQHG